MSDPAKELAILNRFRDLIEVQTDAQSVEVSPVLPIADDDQLPAVFVFAGDTELQQEQSGHLIYEFDVQTHIVISEEEADITESLYTLQRQVVKTIMSQRAVRLNLAYVRDFVPTNSDELVRNDQGEFPTLVKSLIWNVEYRTNEGDLTQ